MNNKKEIILADEGSTCFSSGTMPHYDLKQGGDASAQTERILVLGAGCPECRSLERSVQRALEEMNANVTVGHVTDYAEMAKYGVMSTPALVIDGKVVSFGKVLKKDEVVKILQKIRG